MIEMESTPRWWERWANYVNAGGTLITIVAGAIFWIVSFSNSFHDLKATLLEMQSQVQTLSQQVILLNQLSQRFTVDESRITNLEQQLLQIQKELNRGNK